MRSILMNTVCPTALILAAPNTGAGGSKAKAFTVTATGSYGGIDEGTKLSTPVELVTYYRAFVNDGNEDDDDDTANLSDDAVLALIYDTKGDNAKAENERMVAIIKANEAAKGAVATAERNAAAEAEGKEATGEVNRTIVGRISATTRERLAGEMAARLDNDADLSALFNGLADAKEEVAYSAYSIYKHLFAKYGVEMDKFPVPGTQSIKKDDDKFVAENADYFPRPSRRRGSSGAASASWIDLFSDGFKQIKEWRAEIEQARKKADDAKSNYTKAEYEEEKARLDARINVCKGKVRLAIALHHTLRAAERFRLNYVEQFVIGETDEKTAELKAAAKAGPSAIKVIEWITRKVDVLDDNGDVKIDPKSKRPQFRREVTHAEKCIWLVNPEAETDTGKFHGPFSIQGFVRYDFDEAITKGGSFDDLLSTAQREPDNPFGWNLDKADPDEILYAFQEINLWQRDKAHKLAFNTTVVESTDENLVALAEMDAVLTWMTGVISANRDHLDAFYAKERGDGPNRQSAPNKNAA